MANIKGKQLVGSLAVTNVTGSNVSASGFIIGSSGSFGNVETDNNVTVDGDLFVSQYIKHKGDVNTLINFTDNRIRFKAGDIGFLDFEKDASTPYPFTINQGGNRINFRVMDRNTDLVLKTDSEAFNVGLYHAGNKKLETTSAGIDVSNINVSASGHITASGNISASGDITATNFNGIFIGALSSSAQVDHDSTTNFVANEHIDHSGVTLTAGDGLSGGGDITTNRSFAVDATVLRTNSGAISSSAQISTDISGSFTEPSASISTRLTTAETELGNTLFSGSAQVDHDSTTNFVANEHINHTSVDITAGAGLTGGGDISSTRTLAVGAGTGVTVNANDVAIGQAVSTTSNVQFANITGSNISGSSILGVIGTATQGTIDIHSLSGYVANENIDHSGVTITAGDGLTGGGTIESTRTLTVGAGTGITVNSNDVATDDSAIVHDDLSGFVANEHIDHTSVTLTAGDGLTGGGTIASNRSFAVGAGTGVTVNSDDVAIGQDVATTANVTFASITTTGNVEAEGDVIAQNYIVSSSVTHMTSSLRSGSTISGDTPGDDTHQFTGSLFISGSGTDITTAGNVSITSGSFGYVSGSTLESNLLIASNGDLTLDSSGDIILDADGTDIVLKDGGTSFGSFKRASSDFIIKAETADKDILFKGTDDSTTITALSLDMSESGNAQFLGNISGSQIEASGDVIAFSSSDRRLKNNITPIKNPLEKMDKIGGYTFDWNEKQDAYKGHDVGVIAQEIEDILPELVTTRDTGYKAVKYDKIVPLLIESIKELQKKVQEIEQNCDCLNK